jgi:hypothetical protein
MHKDIPDQDVRRSLARAFDRAWDGYYRSGSKAVKEYLGESYRRFEVAVISTVVRIKAVQRFASAA